ncbi:hypothetical protein BDR04DRAFT_1090239 [Suillus decipiens]|nr:hypothetical protein BDR04DRAFT_1090239 [Suillus decipiens]
MMLTHSSLDPCGTGHRFADESLFNRISTTSYVIWVALPTVFFGCRIACSMDPHQMRSAD